MACGAPSPGPSAARIDPPWHFNIAEHSADELTFGRIINDDEMWDNFVYYRTYAARIILTGGERNC